MVVAEGVVVEVDSAAVADVGVEDFLEEAGEVASAEEEVGISVGVGVVAGWAGGVRLRSVGLVGVAAVVAGLRSNQVEIVRRFSREGTALRSVRVVATVRR